MEKFYSVVCKDKNGGLYEGAVGNDKEKAVTEAKANLKPGEEIVTVDEFEK